jgi:hypothetical protein
VFAHREGTIVYAHAQAGRLFGADAPGELVGRLVFDLVDPSSLPHARARTATLPAPGARVGLAGLTDEPLVAATVGAAPMLPRRTPG